MGAWLVILPKVGDMFGPYKILRQLGQGGMGVVFLAEQTGLARQVALKVLAPSLVDQEEFRGRFHREAGALAKLADSHIVQVYDFGEHDGCLFMAMQYIDGDDLGALINGTSLPVDLSLDICEQITDALIEAHRLGVVHRDLKPSNVLVRRDVYATKAFLCDFGIAKIDNESHTQTGSVIGSYGYMSPEQCRGAAATHTSDLYALGCLLVACITGRAPYPGTDIEVATQHLTAPPPHWEGSDPVTRALNQTVARLMAKEPKDRYPNAQSAKAAIASVRQELALQASTDQAAQTQLSATMIRPRAAITVAKPHQQAVPPQSPQAPPKATNNRAMVITLAAVATLAVIGTIAIVVAFISKIDNTTPTSAQPDTSAQHQGSEASEAHPTPTIMATVDRSGNPIVNGWFVLIQSTLKRSADVESVVQAAANNGGQVVDTDSYNTGFASDGRGGNMAEPAATAPNFWPGSDAIAAVIGPFPDRSTAEDECRQRGAVLGSCVRQFRALTSPSS